MLEETIQGLKTSLTGAGNRIIDLEYLYNGDGEESIGSSANWNYRSAKLGQNAGLLHDEIT